MYSPEAAGLLDLPAPVQISTRSRSLRYAAFSAEHLGIAEQPDDQPRHRGAQKVMRVAQVQAAELLHLAQTILDGVHVDVQLPRARARVAPRREVGLERGEERAARRRVALEHRAEHLAGERLELLRMRAVDEEAQDPELGGAERLPRALQPAHA